MNAWSHLLDAARNDRWDYILATEALANEPVPATLTHKDATDILDYLIRRYEFDIDEPIDHRAIVERVLEHTQTSLDDYRDATDYLTPPEIDHWCEWFNLPITDWYALRAAARLRRFADPIHYDTIAQSIHTNIPAQDAEAVLQFLYDRWTLAFDDAPDQRTLVEAILRHSGTSIHIAIGTQGASEWIIALRQ